MNTLPENLKEKTLSVDKVILDEQIKQILGPRSTYAEKMSNLVNAYFFKYNSDGNKVSGFLVAPKEINNKLPVIIYNRGGTKDFGLLKRGQLFFLPALIASWGYVVLGSQYTGNSASEGKDERGGQDLDAVLKLKNIIDGLSNADTQRIGMFGESRGGMMTYMALARVEWIKTAVVWAGVSDLFRSEKLRPEMIEVHQQAFGKSPAELKKRSAVYWPGKFAKNTSVLILHGDADQRVSHLDSIEISEKLTQNGVTSTLKIYEDGDHSYLLHSKQVKDDIRDWFNAEL